MCKFRGLQKSMFVTSVSAWVDPGMSRNRKMAAIGTGFVYTCEGSRRFRCPKNTRYRQMEPIGTDFVYICEGSRRFRHPKTCNIGRWSRSGRDLCASAKTPDVLGVRGCAMTTNKDTAVTQYDRCVKYDRAVVGQLGSWWYRRFI